MNLSFLNGPAEAAYFFRLDQEMIKELHQALQEEDETEDKSHDLPNPAVSSKSFINTLHTLLVGESS